MKISQATSGGSWSPPSVSRGDEPSQPAGRLASTGKHAKALADKTIKAIPLDATGTKALASGQQTTSTIVLREVVPTGRPAVSVLDVLRTRLVSPSYSFLRQSVRTFAAGPVAEGGTKGPARYPLLQ